MHSHMHFILAYAILFYLLGSTCYASDTSTDIHEVVDGVYVRLGQTGVGFVDQDIANIGFIVGEQCVAVIDTGGSVAEGETLKKSIARFTDTPICYVINTHVHPDHILGNQAFKSRTVKFIGHHRLPRAMALLGDTYIQRASEYNDSVSVDMIIPPDVTISETLDLDLGNRSIRITAHAVAHTDSDLSIYDEASSTLWLSDLLFINHIPVLDGSLAGWIEEIQQLKTINAKYAIAGHGPDLSHWPQAATDMERYLKLIQAETRDWILNDGDLINAPENIGLSEKHRWQLFEHYHKRNVITAYTEIEWE